MSTTCPKCNHTRQPDDTGPDYQCPNCGIVYAKFKSPFVAPEPVIPARRTKGADEKFCSECGETIRTKAEICPKCGVRQLPVPTENNGKPKKQKFTAGLLAIFLGGIGIHKFYLEKSGQGIAYVLFCWTFVPAFIAFVEGLNYLTMSQAVFDQRYNQAT